MSILSWILFLLACIWPALFVLVLRDGLRERAVPQHRVIHLPVINDPAIVAQPMVRNARYWLPRALGMLVMLLLVAIIWPGLVAGWLTTRRGE